MFQAPRKEMVVPAARVIVMLKRQDMCKAPSSLKFQTLPVVEFIKKMFSKLLVPIMCLD